MANEKDPRDGTPPDSRLSSIPEVNPRDVYGIAPQPHMSPDPKDNIAATAAKQGERPKSAFDTGGREDQLHGGTLRR